MGNFYVNTPNLDLTTTPLFNGKTGVYSGRHYFGLKHRSQSVFEQNITFENYLFTTLKIT